MVPFTFLLFVLSIFNWYIAYVFFYFFTISPAFFSSSVFAVGNYFFLHLHCLLILSMFIISSLSSCCLIFCQFKFLNTKFCCFLFFRIDLIYIFLQLKKDLFSFLKTFFYTDKKLVFVFNFLGNRMCKRVYVCLNLAFSG